MVAGEPESGKVELVAPRPAGAAHARSRP